MAALFLGTMMLMLQCSEMIMRCFAKKPLLYYPGTTSFKIIIPSLHFLQFTVSYETQQLPVSSKVLHHCRSIMASVLIFSLLMDTPLIISNNASWRKKRKYIHGYSLFRVCVPNGGKHQMQENLPLRLAFVDDNVYVKAELEGLKAKGVYPYRFRKKILSRNTGMAKRLVIFLLPLEPVFWLLHKIYVKIGRFAK